MVVALAAGSAWGETIELVTYYPAPQTADMHTRSLTVDTPYANELLLDGQAIIYSWVGIGDGFFTAANRPAEVIPAVPTEPLEVQGNILARAPAAKDSLFISDRAAANRLSGLRLRTNDAAQWTVGSRNDGTENLHVFSDASATPATRFFIEQATGNVGIGTTAPAGRLHVVGTDDVVSNVLFMPGADTAAVGVPAIRVGVGTTAPASTFQVQGSLGLGVTVVAGTVTLNETHNIVLCNNGAAMTVSLPAAAQCAGRTYTIKKISNNTLEVVIDPNGAEGIDGQLTLSLYVQNDAVRIVSDGANWDVISDELKPHQAKMTRETPQSVPNMAITKILFDNLGFNVGGIADAAHSRFVIRRAGR